MHNTGNRQVIGTVYRISEKCGKKSRALWCVGRRGCLHKTGKTKRCLLNIVWLQIGAGCNSLDQKIPDFIAKLSVFQRWHMSCQKCSAGKPTFSDNNDRRWRSAKKKKTLSVVGNEPGPSRFEGNVNSTTLLQHGRSSSNLDRGASTCN